MAELAASAKMIEMQARIFDGVRPQGARLFLLKRAESSKRFVALAEITAAWFAKFDKDYRDELKVMIAATGTAIENQIATASFLAYGSGVNAGDKLDVFSFEKKDAFGPNATSPSWKIHTKREADERFTIP